MDSKNMNYHETIKANNIFMIISMKDFPRLQ